CKHSLELAETSDLLCDLFDGSDDAQDAFADGDRNVIGIERAFYREQPPTMLVLLADHERLHRSPVEVLAHLHLDERALLLDHDDHFEAACEILEVLDIQRPGAPDLEKPDTELVGTRLVDAEVVKRLTHVEITLSHGDNADLGITATGKDDAVNAIGANE